MTTSQSFTPTTDRCYNFWTFLLYLVVYLCTAFRTALGLCHTTSLDSNATPTNDQAPRSAMPAEQQSLPLRQQPDSYDNEPPSPSSEVDMAPNQQRGLYDAIFERLVRSQFSKQDFLPEDDFETLVTEDTIKEELDKALGAFDPSLAEYIAKNARKSFATLVIQGKVHMAVNLERLKFNDDYLPIANEESGLSSLNGLSRDRYAWKWFKSWTTQERNDFCEKQWTFLSPIFESNSRMEVLHRDCRLPFITCDPRIERGSFCFVHKATVHHAHHTIGLVRISTF